MKVLPTLHQLCNFPNAELSLYLLSAEGNIFLEYTQAQFSLSSFLCRLLRVHVDVDHVLGKGLQSKKGMLNIENYPLLWLGITRLQALLHHNLILFHLRCWHTCRNCSRVKRFPSVLEVSPASCAQTQGFLSNKRQKPQLCSSRIETVVWCNQMLVQKPFSHNFSMHAGIPICF